MARPITRRDFLNGVAIGTAGLAIGPLASADGRADGTIPLPANYYPPVSTGMRGHHAGSFEVVHELAWNGKRPGNPQPVDEVYDLIVVGAGISGLASVYYHRKAAGPDAKILLLDNHDDFGGHAKRNEFHHDGRMLLAMGGSQNLEFARSGYSAEAMGLLNELSIDLDALDAALDPDYAFRDVAGPIGMYIGGTGKVVTGKWVATMHAAGDYESELRRLPIPKSEQDKLIAFIRGNRDYLADLSVHETWKYLQKTSYLDFLVERVGLTRRTALIFEPVVRANDAVSIDSQSAWAAFLYGAPGLNAVGRLGRLAEYLFVDVDKPYEASFFPDGNATLTRLLVRHLIPEVAPSVRLAREHAVNDTVAARFDYGVLDRKGAPVKIRLASAAVRVREQSDGRVDVDYVNGGRPYRVTGRRCVLACNNGVIPYLCPEMSQAQKDNLLYGVKVPLVQVSVLLDKAEAVNATGTNMFNCSESFYSVLVKAPELTLPDYRVSKAKEDPVVLVGLHSPVAFNRGGQTMRELYREARQRLYTTPFETFEQATRDQLDDMFGVHGFDAARDIRAITANRWSHGYAYTYCSLYDPDFADGEAPHELGRKRFGHISIANADSEAHAYVDGAIDAAWRASREVLA